MIEKLFTKELFLKEMKSTSKSEAIKEMVELLEREGKLSNAQDYENAVLKREEEFSTGIGMGVAIPHGKSSGVKEPALVFAKSTQGIDFDSMDDAPSYLFFLIAVPIGEGEEHLKILSTISRKLMHESIRKKLMAAESYDAVIEVFKD